MANETPTVLNGWTARDLNQMSVDLTETRGDVRGLTDDMREVKGHIAAIDSTLAEKDSEERQADKKRIAELEARPRNWFFYVVVPIAAVVVGEVLAHAHVF